MTHADFWTDSTCYSHFEPIDRQGAEEEKAFVPCSNAQRISRDMEATGIANNGAPLTIEEAYKFIADLTARSLRQSTIRKHELMQRKLQTFCEQHGYIFLRQLGIDPSAGVPKYMEVESAHSGKKP